MSRTRKTNRDHAKKSQRPMVEDGVVATQLEALVTPAITALENYYRRLGLRDRILNLPLMVAALLTLSRAGCGRSQRVNPHPREGRFFGVADLRYERLNMQIIETSIYNASGFSTDFFHTLIKQRRNLLCGCGVERTREVGKAVKHSGYARLG